jgi:hypothetical protein
MTVGDQSCGEWRPITSQPLRPRATAPAEAGAVRIVTACWSQAPTAVPAMYSGGVTPPRRSDPSQRKTPERVIRGKRSTGSGTSFSSPQMGSDPGQRTNVEEP